MKKTGMLLLMLLLSAGAYAQQTDASPSAGSGDGDTPQGTVPTTVSFPTERVQTPTYADLYCAGFVSKQLPNANFVAGGVMASALVYALFIVAMLLAPQGVFNAAKPRRV